MLSPAALAAERDRALAAVGEALGVAAWPALAVRWNRRLRLAGRAVVERRRAPDVRAAIELSPAYFEVYPGDLPGILVHEAVHVGLALLGKPFGHGPRFRTACERAGGLQHSRPLPGRVLLYRCPVCAEVLERRRRPGGDRWCARCAAAAVRDGVPAFAPTRALLLVGSAFRGLDGAAPVDDARIRGRCD